MRENVLTFDARLSSEQARILNRFYSVSLPVERLLKSHSQRNLHYLVGLGLLREYQNGTIRMGEKYGDLIDLLWVTERRLVDIEEAYSKKNFLLERANSNNKYLREQYDLVRKSRNSVHEEVIKQYKTRLAETREHLEKLVNDTSDLDREQEIYCLRAAITAARPGYLDSEDWTRDKAKLLGRERSIKRADQPNIKPNIKPRHSLATVIQWLRKTSEMVFVSGGGHV